MLNRIYKMFELQIWNVTSVWMSKHRKPLNHKLLLQKQMVQLSWTEDQTWHLNHISSISYICLPHLYKVSYDRNNYYSCNLFFRVKSMLVIFSYQTTYSTITIWAINLFVSLRGICFLFCWGILRRIW